MSTQHTPGPWMMLGREVLGPAFDGTYRSICDRVRGGSPEQADSNVRLIAAAPELLAACAALVGVIDRKPDRECPAAALEIARAAIAKAEGRAT